MGKFFSQYDSIFVNYNCKVLYKIDHCRENFSRKILLQRILADTLIG